DAAQRLRRSEIPAEPAAQADVRRRLSRPQDRPRLLHLHQELRAPGLQRQRGISFRYQSTSASTPWSTVVVGAKPVSADSSEASAKVSVPSPFCMGSMIFVADLPRCRSIVSMNCMRPTGLPPPILTTRQGAAGESESSMLSATTGSPVSGGVP